MRSLPSNLILEKNKIASTAPWIVLLEINLKENGVTQATYYLCNNTEDLTYNGDTYTAFPFTISPTRQTAKGEIPTVTLAVANVVQLIQEDIEALSGGVGSEVIVRVVLVESGPVITGDSELEMTFTILATQASAEWLTFTLGAPNPLRTRFPLHRYLSTHCNWEFKGDECGYVGAETSCDRTFDACQAYSNTARFGGFPGLHPTGIRLV